MTHEIIIIISRLKTLSAKTSELLALFETYTEFATDNGIQDPPKCVTDLDATIEASADNIDAGIAAVNEWMANYVA